MEKKIVYIGNFSFPDKNAAGKRVYNNGLALKKAGYTVSFIGRAFQREEKSTKPKYFDGFKYYELFLEKKKLKEQLFSSKYLYGEILACIDDIGIKNIKFIILYGELSNSLFNLKLIKYFQNKKIKVIVDTVEWWVESNKGLIFRTIKNINTKILMRKVNLKADGLITISSFLSDFYLSKEKKTLIIPPLTNIKDNKYLKKNMNSFSDEIEIFYSGIPFREGIKNISENAMKDRLDLAIELVNLVRLKNEAKNKIINFHIYGIDYDSYLYSIPKHKALLKSANNEWLFFHGKTSNDEVIEDILDYDYSILIRDNSLVTNAGFSTKLSESISLMKPVITTNVGDAKKYIVNKKTGLLLDTEIDDNNLLENAEKIATFLKQYSISDSEKKYFEVFDYNKYSDEMKEFFEELLEFD